MARRRSPIRVLLSPFRLLASDPRVSAPLLVAALYCPEQLRRILPAALINSKLFVRGLAFFVALSTLSRANVQLSRRVLNNWQSDAKFVKSQEIVLVTGGSSGIGQKIVEQFAGLGVKVVVMDIVAPKQLPTGVKFWKVDITNTKEIAEAAAEIRETVGHPTVLINNAGVGNGATLFEGTEQQVRSTFEVNTMAHFWMCKEFVPDMVKKDHGHIVTLASMASFVSPANMMDYCCTKASALAFHEGLASELKHRYNAPNVKTTVVHPTWVRTPMIDILISNPNFKQLILEPTFVSNAIVKQVLSGRSAQLVLPEAGTFLSSLRGWPSWMQESLRDRLSRGLAAP